jgi:transcriptional regulator with XRE-family HTH domain
MNNIAWNENIKLYRKKYKLSQKQLSKKLNISEKTLQRYENGTSEPTITVLIKLAQIYDTSIDALIGYKSSSTLNITKIESHIKQIETNCSILKFYLYESEDNKQI